MTIYSIKITYSDKTFTVVRMPATSVEYALKGAQTYVRHNNLAHGRQIIGWQVG